MKTTIIIILFVVIGGLFTAVYLSGSSAITEISVLRDVTESNLSQPKASEILSLFNLDQQSGKWNGGRFCFANISDVSYTLSKETSIGTANQWLSNEYDRANEVKQFDASITKILLDTKSDSVGKKHSSIYEAIANELNRLSHSKATRDRK